MVLTLVGIAQRHHQTQDKQGTTQFHHHEKKQSSSYPRYKTKTKVLREEAIIPNLLITITKLLQFWFTLGPKRAHTRASAKSKLTWEIKGIWKVLAKTVVKSRSRSISSNRWGSRDRFQSMITCRSTFHLAEMSILDTTQAIRAQTCKARTRAISKAQGFLISN